MIGGQAAHRDETRRIAVNIANLFGRPLLQQGT
jgi:hypothetical protein